MICDKRIVSIEPKEKPVNCLHYINVRSTDPSIITHPVGFCSLKEEFLCIEDTDGRFPRLSFSTVSDFLDCHWKYFLKHVKGIRTLDPATGDALKMGQLWDVCLQTLVGDAPRSKITDTINKYEISDTCEAKVKAIYRAFKDLNIVIDTQCLAQNRFELTLPYNQDKDMYVLTGVFDRKYKDHFVESKFSGSPDFYHNLYNIIPQVGTYFASDKDMNYCIMEVVRAPGIHQKELSAEEYLEKCYADIMARPGWYFLGWNKTTRTFGKKFYRKEFDLVEVIERYEDVYYQITDCAKRGKFTKNYKSCYKPFPCDLIPTCLFNVFSETQFGQKEKPQKEKPQSPSSSSIEEKPEEIF